MKPPAPAAPEVAHTAQWSVEPGNLGYGHLKGSCIHDDNSGLVVALALGDVPELDAEANAALIVTAVNSHAALVEALMAARDTLKSVRDSFIYTDDGPDGSYLAVDPEAENHHFDEVCERLKQIDAALARGAGGTG